DVQSLPTTSIIIKHPHPTPSPQPDYAALMRPFDTTDDTCSCNSLFKGDIQFGQLLLYPFRSIEFFITQFRESVQFSSELNRIFYNLVKIHYDPSLQPSLEFYFK